jgi:hypothetical protein
MCLNVALFDKTLAQQLQQADLSIQPTCFNDKKIRGEWFDVTDDEVNNLADFLQKS